MANSIVFQNNAEQLKASIFGYNSTSNAYQALQMNNNGELKVTTGTAIIQVGTISSIGTINRVASIGTLGTVNKVASIGTLGTVNRVASIGTLGTVNKVASIGTLGTVNKVASIGTLGTVNKVASIGTLGTVNKVTLLGTLTNVVGTVKVNLVDRIFTAITQTIAVAASTVTYTNLINISKYQDTSWYLRNITTTNRVVSVRLAATPSTTLTTYPRVLISESTTINASPQVITNDYYLKYISAQISNTATIPQNVVVVFNGRY